MKTLLTVICVVILLMHPATLAALLLYGAFEIFYSK